MRKVILINKNIINVSNPKTELEKAACMSYDILSSCFYSDKEIKPYINDKFKNINQDKDIYFIFDLSRRSIFRYFKEKMKEDIFDFPSGEGIRFLKKKNIVKIRVDYPSCDLYCNSKNIGTITNYINNNEHPEMIKILKIKYKKEK